MGGIKTATAAPIVDSPSLKRLLQFVTQPVASLPRLPNSTTVIICNTFASDVEINPVREARELLAVLYMPEPTANLVAPKKK